MSETVGRAGVCFAGRRAFFYAQMAREDGDVREGGSCRRRCWSGARFVKQCTQGPGGWGVRGGGGCLRRFFAWRSVL
eukprot:8754364-Pyramimonas_sp.AAC.1